MYCCCTCINQLPLAPCFVLDAPSCINMHCSGVSEFSSLTLHRYDELISWVSTAMCPCPCMILSVVFLCGFPLLLFYVVHSFRHCCACSASCLPCVFDAFRCHLRMGSLRFFAFPFASFPRASSSLSVPATFFHIHSAAV